MRTRKPFIATIDRAGLVNLLSFFSAAVGTLLLGGGPLYRDGSITTIGVLVAVGLAVASGLRFWSRQTKKEAPDFLADSVAPLLMVALSWTLYAVGKPLSPYMLLAPAIVLAWITIRYRWPIVLPPIVAALAIESGLALTGNQSTGQTAAEIAVFLIIAAALNLFPGGIMYRQKLREDRRAAVRARANREQAQEMGFDDSGSISAPEILRDFENLDTAEVYWEKTVENINKSFELQLEMIRLALNLSSVAVLWMDPAKNDLRLRYLATNRTDINPGPYSAGTGITGALSGDRDEVELAGFKTSHPGLPYYRKQENTGAIMALRIPVAGGKRQQRETNKNGILCVDRQDDSPWSDQERRVLRLTAEKLGLEISGSKLLLNMDRERSTIHRLFHGLRELNSDPDLDSIFASSMKAVKAQVQTDLLVLCLKDNDRYRLVMAEGEGTEKLVGRDFPLEEGLVGQVIKTARTLPANGHHRGAAPVFGKDSRFGDYSSLLVIPLPDEDQSPIGCLVVAAKPARLFMKKHLEILEIIAGQIAIKIKLGQAHEQLSLLATTDGLTGLANHRTFQHGCNVMLERARRNGDQLCLLLGDLDHFKAINDRFGHPFGDEVLKKVASVIGDSVRTVDLAARYGGEEFAIALENCDAKGGLAMAERIRKKVSFLQLYSDNKRVSVTFSLGVAVFPDHCGDKAELIERADQALYRAKNEGRNRTILWSE